MCKRKKKSRIISNKFRPVDPQAPDQGTRRNLMPANPKKKKKKEKGKDPGGCNSCGVGA